jgi:hypothetical protein
MAVGQYQDSHKNTRGFALTRSAGHGWTNQKLPVPADTRGHNSPHTPSNAQSLLRGESEGRRFDAALIGKWKPRGLVETARECS